VEHALADEIQPFVADRVRVARLMNRTLDLVEALHETRGALATLHPQNLSVNDSDHVALGSKPIPRDHYAAPDQVLTRASNIYTLGVIFRELLGDRPFLAPSAANVIARASAALPSERFASIRAMRDELTALAWSGPACGRWLRACVPSDPRERELLAAARTDPDARTVYADWLEQHGFEQRAAFVRDETPGPVDDAPWRAHLARAETLGCRPECPRRWDLLELTPLHNIRICPGCRMPVFYCASIESVTAEQGAPIAIDVTIDPRLAVTAHRVPPQYLPPTNPPAPGYPTSNQIGGPQPANLMTRLWSLFRRR
jgi:uncharacterized protein (TIGR02996 family)